MKKFALIILAITLTSFIQSQNENLKLHYDFKPGASADSVYDISGNGYHGLLIDNVALETLGGFSMVATGATTGYVQIDPSAGNIFSSPVLTISSYLYVEPSLSIGGKVWSFDRIDEYSNSYMNFYAGNCRYSVSTYVMTTDHLETGKSVAKGSWNHVAIVHAGYELSIYINGILEAYWYNFRHYPNVWNGSQYNYLFKAYRDNNYMWKSKIADFRIYSAALSSEDIVELAKNREKLDTLTFNAEIDTAISQLDLGDLSAVSSNINLPVKIGKSIYLSWHSSNPSIISDEGVVDQHSIGKDTVDVTLTATFTRSFLTKQHQYHLKVPPIYTDAESVALDAASLELEGQLNQLRSDLNLPVEGAAGSVISWSSDQPQLLSHTGKIVSIPPYGVVAEKVVLTALISKNDESETREFEIWVAGDEGYVGYLLTYLTYESTSQYPLREQVRFAYSNDGTAFRSMTNNEPVILADEISTTGTIFNPHILRGEDGKYYMMVADSLYGFVMLKSDNLIDWTSSKIHLPTAFPDEFGGSDCFVLSPRTIYDYKEKKYMVYFSMSIGSGYKIYYSYANDNFTALETVPQPLFNNSLIYEVSHSEIVFWDNKYHLFFKAEGLGDGIMKAISDSLTVGWEVRHNYIQETTSGLESVNLFRLINSDTWMLTFDQPNIDRFDFAQSTDLENFTLLTEGVSRDFKARHGSIIPLTAVELANLRNHWDKVGSETSIEPLSFKLEGRTLHIPVDSLSPNGLLRISDISGCLLHIETKFQTDLSFEFSHAGVYILHYFKKGHGVLVSKVIIP